MRRGGAARMLMDAIRSRSRAFWIVLGLMVAAALLRFLTLGVQSYHHDEVVTASRILPGSFPHAMEEVGNSESTPPLYYALAWLWIQVTGNTEFGLRSLSAVAGVLTVPVVYLIAFELRGRRAGLMAAALAAFNPMLLWYSQEARSYALLVLLCAVSMLYCFRALRGARRRDLLLWGLFSALALTAHYFAVFPLAAEAVLLLRRRGRASLGGIAIIVLTGLALAPLEMHQMSSGHANWISAHSLSHRIWQTAASFVTGETSDVIGQHEHPQVSFLPLALVLAAFALLATRADRAVRRAVSLPLVVAAATIVIPIVLAVIAPSKDFVLARNLIPGLVPILIVVAIAVTMSSARRLGAVIGAALLAYSLGFCIWASASPELQRANWRSVVERLGAPTQPRAIVTWTIGGAPLRYYLPGGATQVHASEGHEWLVHEIDFISQGEVPPPPRAVLGPRFHETGTEKASTLVIRRYAVPHGGLAAIHLRVLRKVPLNFRTNAVELDGISPP